MHDSVLQHLVLVLKSFLKDLPNNANKNWNTIKFVKSEAKFYQTYNFAKGILHLDWILLVDVKGDYVFSFQLALTEVHPDIALFSKSSNRAVLLELTCPCKENIESWHSQKVNKHTPLAKVIEDNKCIVDLFAAEAGAWEYSSSSISTCLKRLGFNDKTVQKTTKCLNCIYMKASFNIWLARNSSVWSSNTSLITIEDANFPATGSKNTNPSRESPSSNAACLSSQPTRHQRKCDQHTKHPGFFTKGNTCYANSILQALSAIPSFGVSRLQSQVSHHTTLDQSSDSEYVTFKTKIYSSGSLQLFLGTLQGIVNQ